jgi:hypothetical protein
MLGLPRPNARLGVVQYANALFHPKTYHLRRDDGSQCAYVGSANFTGEGVTSQHVEAGMLLDTRDGDPDGLLNGIAAAVDDWFVMTRAGLNRITLPADVERLVSENVLAAQWLPPASAGSPILLSAPCLKPLLLLPDLTSIETGPANTSPQQEDDTVPQHCDHCGQLLKAVGEYSACRDCRRYAVTRKQMANFVYGSCAVCGGPVVHHPASFNDHRCPPEYEDRDQVLGFISQEWASVPKIHVETGLEVWQIRRVLNSRRFRRSLHRREVDGTTEYRYRQKGEMAQ